MFTIAPSAQWATTGAAGSGFGGANPAAPTDPTRTTAKPWLRELFVPWMTLNGDVVIGVDAGAGGLAAAVKGVKQVNFYLEGTKVSVPSETTNTFTDANGNLVTTVGYHVTLNFASWGNYGATTAAQLYVEAVPNDPSMQNKVIGPFLLKARSLPSINVNGVADLSKTMAYGTKMLVTPGATGTSTVQPSVKTAVDYLQAHSGTSPKPWWLECTATAGYPLDTVATPITSPTEWIYITAGPTAAFTGSISGTTLTVSAVASGALSVGDQVSAPGIAPNTSIGSFGPGTSGGVGTYNLVSNTIAALPSQTIASRALNACVTATMGNGTAAGGIVPVRIDNLAFVGSGVKCDVAKLSYTLASCFTPDSGSNGGYWFNGIDWYCGAGDPAKGGSASGGGALYNGNVPQIAYVNNPTGGGTKGDFPNNNQYWTECTYHDAYYGIAQGKLVRNVTMSSIGSTAYLNCFCVHGGTNTATNPISVGLRTNINAMTITYSGAAAYAAIEKVTANSNSSFPGALTAGGSGYVNGVYSPVLLTGGTGSGAKASITVSGGVVTVVAISANGSGYLAGDVLSAPASSLGGSGAGFQWTVGGNFNVYEGANAASAVVTHTFLIASVGKVSALVAAISGWGGGWSASMTTDPLADARAANKLTIPGSPPSSSIPKTQLTTGAAFTLGTICDVHSDIAIFFGSPPTPIVNRSFRGLAALGAYACQTGVFFDKTAIGQDIGVRNCLFQDVSVSVTGPGTAQPVYLSGDGLHSNSQSHIWFQDVTTDGSQTLFAGTAGTGLWLPDVYCAVSHCAMEGLVWEGASSTNQQLSSLCVRSGTLPTGSDGNSKTLSGAANTTMYVSPSTNDFRPIKDGPLKLGDQTYAGRYLWTPTENLS